MLSINKEYKRRSKKKVEVKAKTYQIRLKDMQEYKDSVLPVYQNFAFDYVSRLEAFLGSRHSGKTHFIISRLIFYQQLFPDLKILVVRKVQTDIKKSVFATIKTHISKSKFKECYKVLDEEIRHSNGGVWHYKGMDKAENAKGFDGYHFIWVEEGDQLTEEDCNVLELTLRGNPLKSCYDWYTHELGLKMIFSMNPASNFRHWTKKIFHSTYTSEGDFVGQGLPSDELEEIKKNFTYKTCHSTIIDNPFADKETLKKLDNSEKYDPNGYKRNRKGLYAQATELLILRENLHYYFVSDDQFQELWQGWTNEHNAEYANSSTSLERKKELQNFLENNQRVFYIGGADHSQGVEADPMTVVECKIIQRKNKRPLLLVKPILYDNTLSEDRQIFDALEKSEASKVVKYAGDCAQSGRNKSISANGFRFIDCYKTRLESRPTSRKRFKTVLSSKKCYLNDRLNEEFREWSYMQDKVTKEIIEIPADGNDHFQNAIDYAIDTYEKGTQIFSKI